MNSVFMKTAIATAIVAATAGTAIANVDLYGRLRAGVVCTDDGNDTDCGLENRTSRFGIKANHKVTDRLDAFGRYEFQVELDKAQINTKAGKRLAYVGVKGGFGEFSVGTRWSPMYNTIAGPVDPFQLLGGTWSDAGYDNGSGRNQDSINFKKKYGMFSVHAQAMMKDEKTTDPKTKLTYNPVTDIITKEVVTPGVTTGGH
ncbi:MAG TPA: porin, partial [Leucothrix sp.]|nr:porin [Leucothrix sp.]